MGLDRHQAEQLAPFLLGFFAFRLDFRRFDRGLFVMGHALLHGIEKAYETDQAPPLSCS
jgi:hypothetical protein